MRKNNKIKSLCLSCAIVSSIVLTGCSEKPAPIEFEEYKSSDVIAKKGFFPKTFYSVYHDSDWGEKYRGFCSPNIQVDDRPVFTLGKTTMGEIVEAFTGISVEEQLKLARKNEDGSIDEKTEPENEKTDSGDSEQPTYAIKVQIDDSDSLQGYLPLYLISSDTTQYATLQVYKHGEPYIEFKFDILEFYKNMGIHQESDMVVTGVSAMVTENEIYADSKDGLSKAGKSNTYYNGGYNLDGKGLEYKNLPAAFEQWGLTKGDGWSDGVNWYEKVENEKFYYIADVFCYDVIETKDGNRINRIVLKYEIDRESQEIKNVSVDIKNGTTTSASDTISFARPTYVYGED